MSKDPIGTWDTKTPLIVRYHRADFFYEIKFDPEKPHLGIQNLKEKDEEPKKE